MRRKNPRHQRSYVDVADEHGWRIFDYQIPYSRSYAKAARCGLPLSQTSNVHWDRIEGFRRLKNDILAGCGHNAMKAVNQALTLRTKLLVAEYGRKRVIAALAQIEDVEFETIERENRVCQEEKAE